jgi:TonB family C-terminal domain
MTSRGRLGAAVWGAAALVALASTADAQECRRYALSGVRPGEAARDVRSRLGPRVGPAVRLSDASGAFGRESFERDGRRIEVTYDALPDRRESSVALIRAPISDEEMNAVADAFGRAAVGRIEDLDNGPVIWVDPACEIVVTATRQEGRWWEERAGGTFLEVETWASARRRPGSTAANAIAASQKNRTPPPVLVAVVTVPGEDGGDAPSNPVAEGESPPAPEPEPVATTPPAAAPPIVAETRNEAPAVEPPPPSIPVDVAEPPAEPPLTVTAQGVYVAPSRIADSYVPPRYPALLRGARPSARVLLTLTIGESGSVLAAEVRDVNPRGRGFEREAVAAAKQWRYEPGTLDGRPVESRVEVEIEFR